MLPPEFRETLTGQSPEGRLVLAKFDDCVVGYPMKEWEKIEAKFSQIKNPNRNVRNFMRFFLGGAEVVGLDKQGRILVPQSHRSYGNLEKEVVLVGVGFKFEIWDKARFEDIEAQNFDNVSADIAETGVELSF